MMTAKRLLSLAFGAMLAGAMMLAVPAAASASEAAAVTYEWDTATSGSLPDDVTCVPPYGGGRACFQPDGDRFWVKDIPDDGHSFTASWEDWFLNASNNWVLRRQGSCVNKLGGGKWAQCNKNFTEGDMLFISACIYDSANGTWHGCSARYYTYA
jgi:hypothetical protein